MKKTFLLATFVLGALFSKAQSVQVGNATCTTKYFAMYADAIGSCTPLQISNIVAVPAGTMVTYDMYPSSPAGPNPVLSWSSGIGAPGTFEFTQVRIIESVPTSPISYNLGLPTCGGAPVSQTVSTWPCTRQLNSDWSNPRLIILDFQP